MESWSISRDSTIPLGSLCIHRDAPSHKPLIKIPPSKFPPYSGFYVFILYTLQETHGSACVLARCGVQSSGILVALWPTCVVLFRYFGSPISAGVAWYFSPRIFMFPGCMKAAFAPSHPPGPWCARRLDSADVDSRAWLVSTRTYIAFAVPFMV